MKEEDAISIIVSFIREKRRTDFSNYGYDIYVPNIMYEYLRSIGIDSDRNRTKLREFSPVFFNAAWELCRRGILRPGVRVIGEQSTDQGSAGSGFSITAFGYQWLNESEQDSFVPTEPERFAQMLIPYREKFGEFFYERAQEAVRCYGAHAYLACCTMCGAATESILLSASIAKIGDERSAFKTYYTSNGRVQIENILVGQANDYLKREFRGFTSLLKYWRDEASHGGPTSISDNEAYTSLAMLLRFAMFVNKNWEEITLSL